MTRNPTPLEVEGCTRVKCFTGDSGRLKEVITISSVKIGRDAGTGKFIPVKVATSNPKGAVVETIRKPTKGK